MSWCGVYGILQNFHHFANLIREQFFTVSPHSFFLSMSPLTPTVSLVFCINYLSLLMIVNKNTFLISRNCSYDLSCWFWDLHFLFVINVTSAVTALTVVWSVVHGLTVSSTLSKNDHQIVNNVIKWTLKYSLANCLCLAIKYFCSYLLTNSVYPTAHES